MKKEESSHSGHGSHGDVPSAVKSERTLPAGAHLDSKLTMGAAHSAAAVTAASHAGPAGPGAHAAHAGGAAGLKTENEPSESDIIKSLTATAAAAAAAATAATPSSQSATAAPPVVPVTQQEVNYGPSGLLATAALTVNGVEVKYTEPIEARVPDKAWRLYVFKNKEPMGQSNHCARGARGLRLLICQTSRPSAQCCVLIFAPNHEPVS